jgi:hypothetical protein
MAATVNQPPRPSAKPITSMRVRGPATCCTVSTAWADAGERRSPQSPTAIPSGWASTECADPAPPGSSPADPGTVVAEGTAWSSPAHASLRAAVASRAVSTPTGMARHTASAATVAAAWVRWRAMLRRPSRESPPSRVPSRPVTATNVGARAMQPKTTASTDTRTTRVADAPPRPSCTMRVTTPSPAVPAPATARPVRGTRWAPVPAVADRPGR